jgi:hypothetical protein
MRNRSIAHPESAVYQSRDWSRLKTVVELQFIHLSLESAIWVDFFGLTYPM